MQCDGWPAGPALCESYHAVVGAEPQQGPIRDRGSEDQGQRQAAVHAGENEE